MSPSPQEILLNYPEATDFDKCIILLRSYKWTYGQISVKLGSPSKRSIRDSLLKWAPDLIEEDCNRQKLKPKERASKEEFILMSLLRKSDKNIFYMGHPLLGNWKMTILENRLYYIEDDGDCTAFGTFDPVCQYQFLEIIKSQLN